MDPIDERNAIHPNASEDTTFIERYAIINHIQIYYECQNCDPNSSKSASYPESWDSQTAMLIIHGWTANRLRLHPLYIYFAQKGIPVFRLDLRGHGWSQKDGIQDFSLEAMITDIREFITQVVFRDYHFNKIILIAHSMGGAISQILAIRYPNGIKKLILIGTAARFLDRWYKRFLSPLFVVYYRRHYWKKYFGKKKGHAKWGLEHFPMWSDKYDTKGRSLFTTPEATLQGIRSMSFFDSRRQLNNLQIPTLILVGEDDIDAPVRFSQELHRLIPHSLLHIISGANHDLVIAKPLTVGRLIEEFLEQ